MTDHDIYFLLFRNNKLNSFLKILNDVRGGGGRGL